MLKDKKLHKAKLTTKKKFTKFRPMILSRHPSHRPFRRGLPLFPRRSVIRFGSTTQTNDGRIEINRIEAIKNSASKLLMKKCFQDAGVTTAEWIQSTYKDKILSWAEDKYPIVKKSFYGSRGMGNTLIKNGEELSASLSQGNLKHYLFEKYYSYSREYRLHVTKNGCFYTCRKLLKNEAPKDKRWQRHDDNCVWILETNPSFDKPSNWNDIVADCVKALQAVGLDFCACDVKVQSTKKLNGAKPKWIILETNSAPSMGAITLEKYLEELPKLIKSKI